MLFRSRGAEVGEVALDLGRGDRAHFRTPIPADLWAELKAENLLHPAAPTP